MQPLITRWTYLLPFALVFLWAFSAEVPLMRRLKQEVAESGKQDARSAWVLLVGQQVGLALGFALAFEVPGAAVTRWRLGWYVGGLALIVAGGLLRRYCFRLLGPSFTGAVVVKPGQPLVTRGPYRWVRHPGYTAGMLLFLGIAMCLTNWLTLVVIVLSTAATFVYRARVEEAALVETLGEPYREYMRRTKRFVPFVV